MVRSIRRWLSHLTTGTLARRRAFPQHAMQAIEDAIRACESRQVGEIRFALDSALSISELWRGLSPRECAQQAFAQLRVWDTEHNDGVLIYVLLADRDVEIVADRGVGRRRVPQNEWDACCRTIEALFAKGHFRQGAVAGIEAVAAVLARHRPDRADFDDELPNPPALL